MFAVVSAFGLLLRFGYETAYASGLSTACSLVGGCNATNSAPTILAQIGSLLVSVVAAGAVVFVVWGGAQMLISLGDESQIAHGRQSIINALIGLGLALASQSIVAFMVGRANTAAGGGNPLLAIAAVAVNAMLALLNVTFVIIALAAGFRLVIGQGKSEETDKARTMLMYAVAGAIIINVARPLVEAVLNLNL